MRDIFPLSVIISILASASSSRASSIIQKRWKYPLNIDWDPAVPPEEGAPLSFNALRDKSYLPAEIGGIVGAYVFVVASALLFVIVVGRRLRRRLVEEAVKPREVEMLAPPLTGYTFYPSPVSPGSGQTAGTKNFSWPSPEKDQRNPYIFPSSNVSPVSPGSAFDAKTIEMDRSHLQQGLEDLYAHVMAQEEAKASGVNIADLPAPVPSVSPQRGNGSKKRLEKPLPINLNAPEKSHSRSSSFMSSIKSPKRKGIRGMKISSPLATPMSSRFPQQYASDEEPLSPRHYHPQPPPPVPGKDNVFPSQQQPYIGHSRQASSINQQDPSPVSPTRSIAEQMDSLRVGPAPNNRSIATSRPPVLTIPTAPPVRAAAPPPLSFKMPPANNSTATLPQPQLQPNASAASSTRQLPFRAFDPPPGLNSPSFSVGTKTTVLERTTPLSPGLKTPWSAGAVPYTPYQPFTPLMPVTPRLVTREERKKMRREMPKSPTMEMVRDEEDLWDV